MTDAFFRFVISHGRCAHRLQQRAHHRLSAFSATRPYTGFVPAMSTLKSPLRDRLLSNSPDPIKSSIIRDSGMGWISPMSNPGSISSGSSGSITSPLRIAKRDSPRIPPQPQVARRSSSSYKHVRNNNLVSKSPFKSQVPTPSSTPARPIPIAFPSPRRVSGEKRPRPSSMHEQAEDENERPFALKRERRESKGFQGLIQKEPVTKSPFKQRTPSTEEHPLPAPPPPLVHLISRPPLPSFSSVPQQVSLIPMPKPVSSTGVSPGRSSLVSKRMHGPRLSSGGGGRRERRKTVTFDERCDVVEFDCEEDESDHDVFDDTDDQEDDYGMEPETDLRQIHYPVDGEQQSAEGPVHESIENESYESLQLSDLSGDVSSGPSLLGMALDPDASISGLVDEMFAASSATALGGPTANSHAHSGQFDDNDTVTSTPPRHHDSFDLPTDLETEDGVPLGRSHHAARFVEHHHQHSQSPRHSPQPPPHFSPHIPQHSSPLQRLPEGVAFNLPTHASPYGPPATPPRRSAAPSPSAPPVQHLTSLTSNSVHTPSISTPPPNHQPNPPPNLGPSHLTTPPLGRSTHVERIRKAREEECDDVLMLPGTPSPCKNGRKPGADPILGRAEGLIPRFGLQVQPLDRSKVYEDSNDPFTIRDTNGTDDSATFEEGATTESMDPSNLSVGGSEVGLDQLTFKGYEEDLKGMDGTLRASAATEHTPQEEVYDTLQQDPPQNKAIRPEQQSFPTRPMSPYIQSSSPRLHGSSSSQSLNGSGSVGHQRINRDEVKRRLLERRSSPASLDASPASGLSMQVEDKQSWSPLQGPPLGEHEREDKDKDSLSVITTMTDISTEVGIIELAEKKILTGTNAGEAKEFGFLGVGQRLQFDFGSKFGMGGLDMGTTASDGRRSSLDSMGVKNAPGPSTNNTDSIQSSSSMKMGDVDVDMDMRSALDRLMDDVAGTQVDDSMVTDEGDSQLPTASASRSKERAMTDSALLHNNGFVSRNASASSGLSIPPPVPPKDNIRSREQLILEKRREARRLEEESDGYYPPAKPAGRGRGQELLGVGRPSRRRSMSTGDAEGLGGGAKARGDILLDLAGVGVGAQDDPLADVIEKELKKMVETPRKQKTKYLVRERQGTIYASSSDLDGVSHMVGPGDVNTGRAWRAVRRPSDMNEYSKQIKEYRAQEKSGKAYGKVFVKVLGVKGIHVPLPQHPTALTCTLNNGIHFVSTPECQLGRDFRIDQEFELIEHSKLEFTLTLKVRRDPHIIAQFKAISSTPTPAPAPPPVAQAPSKGGMRNFFSSSPKKSKDKLIVQPPAPPPAPQRLTENLARYLKPDGTLARAFISFKDVAARCDTRLFETSYPLIGQRVELGGKFSTLQVGEIVLQMFRLPPLHGIAPEQLPQSLEECHRGLRHINWHKVTYFEGTLTQSGGDCSTWRRRQLRVIGANLVAFNDVTKKATATIDLKKAIAVEDDQEVRSNTLSPTAGRNSRYDDDDRYGVERSFRLIFPQNQEIIFFADTDEEKSRWLDVLRALVGHIPPHTLWAELLWQQQEEQAKATQSPPSAYRPVPQPSPSWLVARSQQR
ncbi:Bud site selection protein BUD4 [Hypsizygus marmoreus]|uniref:Bud site selection protein BUD4 n=1 Tax=Hypsizygus marmoreus TaxID=39966 RepID=A0A369JY73_HYPMA|nr:Bud site selection protein BUD4 [Hypsizygus marmoreus]